MHQTLQLISNSLSHIGIKNENIKTDLLTELSTIYCGQDRTYHNWTHIAEGLIEIEFLSTMDKNYLDLVIPWLFHDRVLSYQDDDEEQSETSCCNYLQNLGIDTLLAESLSSVIRGTNHISYKEEDLSPLQSLMHDIDLLPLSYNLMLFEANTRLIFNEVVYYHPQMDFETYLVNRLKFFQRMLDRPRIFYTDMYSYYEKFAVANLQKFIENNKDLLRETS